MWLSLEAARPSPRFALIRVALVAVLGLTLVGLARAQAAPATTPENAFLVAPGTRGATLNGEPLLPGTAVLAGETITTAAGGVVVLTPSHGAGGVIEISGAASATVRSGAVGAGGSDQLQMNSGAALVSGPLSIFTPQGQIFTPVGEGTTYLVNAGAGESSMGVLTGNVRTSNPSAANATSKTIPAGNAIQVYNANGQFRPATLDSLSRPPANGTLPPAVPASQSQ